MTVIISTHLDDAVWSCHSLLEGATVVTICAGIPGGPPSEFDKRAGFTTGAQAMRARRAEDKTAALIAGFTSVHLDVLDCAYGGGDIDTAVRWVLDDAKGQMVVGPLGLRHPDHVAVAQAFRAHGEGMEAWVYEDLPYAYVWPEHLASALEGLSPETLTRLPEGKEETVRAYASQINDSTHMAAILAPERLHRL